MKVEARRKELITLLMSSAEPLSGTALARQWHISRQIIVQDIAALKDAGYEILSTYRGYVMQHTPLSERVFKVYHTKDDTEAELSGIVDLGGTIVNVFVWHKIYGKIEVQLNISSRYHVQQFIEGIRSGKSTELMGITGGYHYHTIRADSTETLDRISAFLSEHNYLVPEI